MPTQSGLQDGRCTLDWLAFTLPFEDGLSFVEDLFGEGEERPRGTKGYSNSATLPCGGTVSWSPLRPEMKVHVVLSSSQLARAAELNPHIQDVRGFLTYLVDLDASFTRIDFALDDRTGQLDMGEIGKHVKHHWLTSRWRKGRHVLGTLEAIGETFEFGSRVSESFLRIYDKQAEQIDKGQDDPGHWIRVELELKGDKAQHTMLRYLRTSDHCLEGLLRGLLQFREPGQDETKSRWAVCDWWARFLDWAKIQRITIPKAEPSIERDLSWVHTQWSRTLARLLEAHGGATDWLHAVAYDGSLKLTKSDRQRARAYLQWRQEKRVQIMGVGV